MLFKALRLLLASRADFWPALGTLPLQLMNIRWTRRTEGVVARHRRVDIRLAGSQSERMALLGTGVHLATKQRATALGA